jgi:putative endonuclease
VSRKRGDAAEAFAVRYLMERGCRILARNFYFRGGEIDIVAEKEGVIRFVEVKSGRGFEPVYNLTPEKLRRVVNGAQTWLKKHDLNMPWQIDALVIRDGECEWIENVTV